MVNKLLRRSKLYNLKISLINSIKSNKNNFRMITFLYFAKLSVN